MTLHGTHGKAAMRTCCKRAHSPCQQMLCSILPDSELRIIWFFGLFDDFWPDQIRGVLKVFNFVFLKNKGWSQIRPTDPDVWNVALGMRDWKRRVNTLLVCVTIFCHALIFKVFQKVSFNDFILPKLRAVLYLPLLATCLTSHRWSWFHTRGQESREATSCPSRSLHLQIGLVTWRG